MARIRFLTLLSAFSVSGLIGCGDKAAPTQPAPAISLNGHWSGTVTSLQGSAGTEAACVYEPIAADVTQEGASVAGLIVTSCVGSLELSGSVEGDTLTGALIGHTSAFRGGRVSAAVSSSRIQMTVGHSTKDVFVPVLSIDLVR